MKEEQLSDYNRAPGVQHVNIYFNQKGMPAYEAENFFRYYEKKQWNTKNGIFMAKWKDFAYRWIAAIVHDQPLFFNRHIH